MPIDFSWRDFVPFPPLSAFDYEANHVRPARTALGESIFRLAQGTRMAGCRLRPTFAEFCDWLRSPNLTDVQKHYVRELVIQCHPLEWKMLATNSGATAYEIARAMIASGVDRGSYAGWAFPRAAPGEPVPVLIARSALSDQTLLATFDVIGRDGESSREMAQRIV